MGLIMQKYRLLVAIDTDYIRLVIRDSTWGETIGDETKSTLRSGNL